MNPVRAKLRRLGILIWIFSDITEHTRSGSVSIVVMLSLPINTMPISSAFTVAIQPLELQTFFKLH
ncbi:hypothetical protein N7481_006561 [Penicillium waksmanii]|uniref:uncharacterized protein n=1 Tax=Penicillium waksmanii TaxID=69791 RepID=UPI0025479601|nr:uncharacterized protein N7481_006561 [Penicillium waksmanii]KAJ5984462.1 hypothetical protein N7481_006561 [Penicillium waksmanii]